MHERNRSIDARTESTIFLHVLLLRGRGTLYFVCEGSAGFIIRFNGVWRDYWRGESRGHFPHCAERHSFRVAGSIDEFNLRKQRMV